MAGHWKPGVVTGHEETPRSYRIQTDEGREYRRNRKMLMKSPESAPLSPCTSARHESPSVRANESAPLRDQAGQTTPSVKEPTSRSFEPEASQPADEEISEPRTTASGSIVRRPLRFKEYVS